MGPVFVDLRDTAWVWLCWGCCVFFLGLSWWRLVWFCYVHTASCSFLLLAGSLCWFLRFEGLIRFGYVGFKFALVHAVVLCCIVLHSGSWVLLELFCLLRVTTLRRKVTTCVRATYCSFGV